MSRVDGDNDTQAAQDARYTEKQQRQKVTDEQAAAFKKMLAQKETSRTQQQAQPQIKGKPTGQRQSGGSGGKSAQNALLARQGIAANALRAGLEKRDLKQEATSQGEINRQDKLYSDDKYDSKKHDDEVKDTKRDAVKDDERQTEVLAREESRQNPLERDQGQGSGSSNTGSQSGAGGGGGGMMGGGGGFGGSAAAPSQAASTGTQMSSAQIAAIEIARKIADKMAIGSVSGLAVAEIQLKEGILAGSQVRITYDQLGKVNVVFTTSDRNTARLVDHSDTRKELARQLKNKNFTLGDLVVERK
jgi:hypothetical protein